MLIRLTLCNTLHTQVSEPLAMPDGTTQTVSKLTFFPFDKRLGAMDSDLIKFMECVESNKDYNVTQIWLKGEEEEYFYVCDTIEEILGRIADLESQF